MANAYLKQRSKDQHLNYSGRLKDHDAKGVRLVVTMGPETARYSLEEGNSHWSIAILNFRGSFVLSVDERCCISFAALAPV
jgi:hypothetical protein